MIADSGADVDRDGLTNLQEYLAGTDPRDADDALRLDVATDTEPTDPPRITLRFQAKSNRSYMIQYAESLKIEAWSNLTPVLALPSDRYITLTNVVSGDAPTRFYRVTIP